MRKTLYDALEKTAGAAGENTTEMTDKEKLRLLMRSTLDNINLSEQIARRTGDDDVRLAARIAARKDKETMDKLQAVLKRIDVDKFPVEPAKEYVDGSIQKKANIDLPIKLGDIILGGKYKNRREVVETIDWDELGQPVVNGKKLLTVRIEKKLPKRKWSAKTLALIKKASENVKPLGKLKGTGLSPEEIKDYIKRYYEASDDKSHGPDHIELVRKSMSELADKHGYKDKALADAAALLHDIGNIKDRKRHEIVGADMAASDPLLAKRFDKRRLRLLVNAIRQHRASTGKPRSVLGKMLSDSDRLSSWPDESAGLRRAMAFGRKHEPELSDDEQLDRSVAHQIGKYGPGGYGLKATYFPESAEHINKMMIPLLKAHASGDDNKLREIAGL